MSPTPKTPLRLFREVVRQATLYARLSRAVLRRFDGPAPTTERQRASLHRLGAACVAAQRAMEAQHDAEKKQQHFQRAGKRPTA